MYRVSSGVGDGICQWRPFHVPANTFILNYVIYIYILLVLFDAGFNQTVWIIILTFRVLSNLPEAVEKQ